MNAFSVSVIIPTYNRAHLVGRAIQSALACLLPGDEILVVDDGSRDDTEKVVRSMAGPILFLPGPHGGAGFSRNRGIRAATRPLVAFLDSDDEWQPHKLRLQRAFMERRPDILFCFSNFTVRDEEGEKPAYLPQWHKDPRPWDDILGPGAWYSSLALLPPGLTDFKVHGGRLFLQEMLSDYVATSTVVVRGQEAGNALVFAEDLTISEDKECFGRLAQRGQAAYFDCDLSYQYGHAGHRVSDANTYQLARARIELMERIWGKDEAFMAAHAAAYEDKMRQQNLIVVRYLLARGQTAEARQALRRAGNKPWQYRLLAALPGPITKGLLGLRRMLRWRRPSVV